MNKNPLGEPELRQLNKHSFLRSSSEDCTLMILTRFEIIWLIEHAVMGQRHIILSPIDAHYKWPPNKIYSHVS